MLSSSLFSFFFFLLAFWSSARDGYKTWSKSARTLPHFGTNRTQNSTQTRHYFFENQKLSVYPSTCSSITSLLYLFSNTFSLIKPTTFILQLPTFFSSLSSPRQPHSSKATNPATRLSKPLPLTSTAPLASGGWPDSLGTPLVLVKVSVPVLVEVTTVAPTGVPVALAVTPPTSPVVVSVPVVVVVVEASAGGGGGGGGGAPCP